MIDATRQPNAAACSSVAPAARRRRSRRWCCRRPRRGRSARPPGSRPTCTGGASPRSGSASRMPSSPQVQNTGRPARRASRATAADRVRLPSRRPGTRAGSASARPTGTARCTRGCRRGRTGRVGRRPPLARRSRIARRHHAAVGLTDLVQHDQRVESSPRFRQRLQDQVLGGRGAGECDS